MWYFIFDLKYNRRQCGLISIQNIDIIDHVGMKSRIKLPHQNGWSLSDGAKWRQWEWFLRLYAAGVCNRILPHSPAALTAPGRTSAAHGAPTSCHQSDRRQLSPYIWRPQGAPRWHPPQVSVETFPESDLRLCARGKWNVSVWRWRCVKTQSWSKRVRAFWRHCPLDVFDTLYLLKKKSQPRMSDLTVLVASSFKLYVAANVYGKT